MKINEIRIVLSAIFIYSSNSHLQFEKGMFSKKQCRIRIRKNDIITVLHNQLLSIINDRTNPPISFFVTS